MQLNGRADFLLSFIWSHVSGSQCIQQQMYIKFCANLRKSVMETLAMTRQAFREDSMSRTQMSECHARFRADQKRRQVKSKVKSMLIIITSRGLFTKNSSWQNRHLHISVQRLRTLATKELTVASKSTISHFLSH
jgi:hypothetical protein